MAIINIKVEKMDQVSSDSDSGVVSGHKPPRDVDKSNPLLKTIWFRSLDLDVTVLSEKNLGMDHSDLDACFLRARAGLLDKH